MDFGPLIAEAVKAAAPYVIPLIATGITALGGLIGRWIHQHTKDNKTMSALASSADYVGAAVSHVLDAVRPEIVKALADDGKISNEEAAAIKKKVIELIMVELPGPLKDVAKAMGPGFEVWLSGKVGQSVADNLAVESKFVLAAEALKP